MDDPNIFRKFFFAFLKSIYFNSRKNAIKNFGRFSDGLGLEKAFFGWFFGIFGQNLDFVDEYLQNRNFAMSIDRDLVIA